jgi:uncharacterized protein
MATETETTNQVEQVPVDNKEENMWAMFCHLASFAGLVFPIVGSVLGPLVIWLLKKDEYPLVNDQGKEAMNFNISMVIYYIASIILIIFIIGIPLLIGLFLFDVVVTIIAMVKASEGEKFRYPLAIRLID